MKTRPAMQLCAENLRSAYQIILQAIGIARSWILHRGWFLEIVGVVLTALVFFVFWRLGGVSLSNSTDAIKQVWSILPLLAITNAIPVLAVSAFLARYSLIEKPSETTSKINDVLAQDYNRLEGHPRDNPFDRTRYYVLSLKRAKIREFKFNDNEEWLYTVRPHWDGVWYVGGDDVQKLNQREAALVCCAHELVFCAFQTLRVVRELRKSSFALVGGSYGGTQGSTWFLEEFDKLSYIRFKRIPNISIIDAYNLVRLAKDSAHYMFEEYRNHRSSAIRDERAETHFIHIFCDYLIWLGYFHGKLVKCRATYIYEESSVAREKIVNDWYEKNGQGISEVDKKIKTIRSENLPRKFVTERMRQIRIGAIVPILMTSTVILMYLFGQPYLYDKTYEVMIPFVSTFLYIGSSCAIVVNFIFALFLLLPGRMKEEENIVH